MWKGSHNPILRGRTLFIVVNHMLRLESSNVFFGGLGSGSSEIPKYLEDHPRTCK